MRPPHPPSSRNVNMYESEVGGRPTGKSCFVFALLLRAYACKQRWRRMWSRAFQGGSSCYIALPSDTFNFCYHHKGSPEGFQRGCGRLPARPPPPAPTHPPTQSPITLSVATQLQKIKNFVATWPSVDAHGCWRLLMAVNGC